MQPQKCSILSIAPYRLLPPKSGGQLGIVLPHHYLGQLCPDHVVSTVDNDEQHNYAFQLHRIFPTSPKRYLPYYQYKELLGFAKMFDATGIYCEHPYMALTAMRLSRRLKIPWFLRSHNIESQRFKDFGKSWWKVLHYYERYAMRKASGVFFVTVEDADWAQENFQLEASRCHVIPFGTTLEHKPEVPADIKEKLAIQFDLPLDKPWLYFLGALDYAPNEQAVEFILDEIIPRLDGKNFAYKIIIAGKGLSEKLQQRIEQAENIRYAGFIPDLNEFLNACDIMLNPVIMGGGIKTKAIEALGYNKTVISTHSGAAGLIREACGKNLIISADNDWNTFADDVVKAAGLKPEIPQAFYETYYWGNVMKKALKIMQETNW